jgi:hypothetical protein
MSIAYREGHDVDLDQLTLFNGVGWQARPSTARVSGNNWSMRCSLYPRGRSIGWLALHAVSDGLRWGTGSCQPAKGRGSAHELTRRVTSGHQGIHFVLHARPAVKKFYLKCGFEHTEDMLRIPRRF